MDIPTLKALYIQGIDKALNLPWPFSKDIDAQGRQVLQSARDTFVQATDAQMQPFLDNFNKEPE